MLDVGIDLDVPALIDVRSLRVVWPQPHDRRSGVGDAVVECTRVDIEIEFVRHEVDQVSGSLANRQAEAVRVVRQSVEIEVSVDEQVADHGGDVRQTRAEPRRFDEVEHGDFGSRDVDASGRDDLADRFALRSCGSPSELKTP